MTESQRYPRPITEPPPSREEIQQRLHDLTDGCTLYNGFPCGTCMEAVWRKELMNELWPQFYAASWGRFYMLYSEWTEEVTESPEGGVEE